MSEAPTFPDLTRASPGIVEWQTASGSLAYQEAVATMEARTEVMRAQAGAGFALATEVADHLARKGVPFAEAHEISGALVRYCEEMGRELEGLEPVELRAIDPRLDESVLKVLTLDAAVAARSGHGGTAPERVVEQIGRFRGWLSGFAQWTRERAA